ncbi:Ribonuclease BN [hydrothermal vent metagenome]|uniref:Ribonuclease BN n=1 Tax=hydrothermal vent metagenome TaxID=652676 RepID=A0A3B1A510_9ZZZZ
MIDYIQQIRLRIITLIWDTNVSCSPVWQRYLINTSRITYLTFRDLFFDGQLNLRAMSLVYTTLLSIVPLIAVSVSVLKGFGAHNQIEPALLNLLEPLGERGPEISATIMTFVNGINFGLLGSVGLMLLLYTVISLIHKIESAFNFTWHVTEERTFVRRFSDYFSVILIGPVLVFTAIGLTATLTNTTLYKAALDYDIFISLVSVFEITIPYTLIILAFTFLYVFIPNTKVKFSAALIGAIFAGLAWQSLGWLFASYVSKANYSAIYSAFAALFFFMIWVYISWTIILVGACIAFYYQNPAYRSRNKHKWTLSNRMKEIAVLTAMLKITECYYSTKRNITLNELIQYLNIPSESLAPIIQSLLRTNLLIRTDAEPAELIPGKAPDALTVDEILKVIRQAEEDNVVKISHLPEDDRITALYVNYQTAAQLAIQGMSLKDLLESDVYKSNLADKSV